MPTTKNKLFIGILAFMLIVNILVIFDINYFYIRAILGFVFLITIPGLLIMLCLKIRNINFWEYLVYTIGLSVAFIMFAGLAVNWILPFLNITDKPLSLWPILICFDTILLILWLIAHKRNEDNIHLLIFPFDEYETNGKKGIFNFIPKLTKFTWLDRIFMIIPISFPFMAVIGAFLLNNHGTNIITMIMLGSIAVYVLLVVIFRDKLNENVFPWALYFMGLALLLMFSMRSWYISGGDIITEYNMFQFTKENFSWSISRFSNHPYNAMLSLTILPTIFFLFSKINNHYLYKFLFQIIFPFVPIIIYSIIKKYDSKATSFLSSFFFISFVGFLVSSPMHIRQEMAFLFFGLILLVLFSIELNPKIKNLFFVIFGFSMIVSHYSTAYISLAIFLLTYIIILIYRGYEHRKIKKGKLHHDNKTEFHLTGILVVLLIIFAFLWYSQVTGASEGLVIVSKKTFNNMWKIFNDEKLIVTVSNQKILEDFSSNLTFERNSNSNFVPYFKDTFGQYSPYILPSENLPENINKDTSSKIQEIGDFLNNLTKIFSILGLFYIIIYFKKRIDKLCLFLGILSILILLFLRLFPVVGLSYDPMRLYYQILFIISWFTITGVIFIVSLFNKKNNLLIASLFFIIFFLFSSGFVYQLTGGFDATLQLNNLGKDYNRWYSSEYDLNSVYWLIENENGKDIITLSNYNFLKFNFLNSPMNGRIFFGVIPSTIDKNSYVFLNHINKLKGVGMLFPNGLEIFYNFPTEFLNDNKNKIYNNGGSEIFK